MLTSRKRFLPTTALHHRVVFTSQGAGVEELGVRTFLQVLRPSEGLRLVGTVVVLRTLCRVGKHGGTPWGTHDYRRFSLCHV